MKRYDPLRAPDPAEWLALNEHRRIHLAEEHHRRARIRLPNLKAHAVTHVIVENQMALGEEIPVRTLRRLMAEGLNRHEAVHAVGMVLMELIFDVMKQPEAKRSEPGLDPNKPYYDALETLTAESLRNSGSEQ
jgi:hypothetical protein